MHLSCKERLFDAYVAADCMIRLEAVQQTAMPLPLAVAVARLLSQNAWDFFRNLICLPDISPLESRRIKCDWKWSRVFGAVVKNRHCRGFTPRPWWRRAGRNVENARYERDSGSAEDDNRPM